MALMGFSLKLTRLRATGAPKSGMLRSCVGSAISFAWIDMFAKIEVSG